MKTRCYQKLLFFCKKHRTNEQVRKKSQAGVGKYDGKYDELLTLAMSQGLLLQGTVEGKRENRQTEEEVRGGNKYLGVEADGF
ncbi:MAG: hypothetical protein AB2693_21020 [Candidatus Thiodiazotropha sp.]